MQLDDLDKRFDRARRVEQGLKAPQSASKAAGTRPQSDRTEAELEEQPSRDPAKQATDKPKGYSYGLKGPLEMRDRLNYLQRAFTTASGRRVSKHVVIQSALVLLEKEIFNGCDPLDFLSDECVEVDDSNDGDLAEYERKLRERLQASSKGPK